MLHITTGGSGSKESEAATGKQKTIVAHHLREKMKTWINSLWGRERDEFLGRGRHAPLDESHSHYRNDYRPRGINLFGSGRDRAESAARP